MIYIKRTNSKRKIYSKKSLESSSKFIHIRARDIKGILIVFLLKESVGKFFLRLIFFEIAL
jgi:hypothetical protein